MIGFIILALMAVITVVSLVLDVGGYDDPRDPRRAVHSIGIR